MKRLAMLAVVALALTVLAPILPGAAEAQPPLVEIIHNGMIILVDEAAVPAHLAHGDTFVCVPPECS